MSFDSDAYEFVELKKSKDLCKYFKFFKASPMGVKLFSIFVVLEVFASIIIAAIDGSKIGYGVIIGLYLLGAILKREKWAYKTFIAWRFFVIALALVLFIGIMCTTDRQMANFLTASFTAVLLDVITSIPSFVAMFFKDVKRWANNATSFKCYAEKDERGNNEQPKSSMSINCPSCQEALEIDADYIGRKGQCPFCQHKFIIEAPAESAPSAPFISEHKSQVTDTKINYWGLFKSAPLSVKISTCELTFFLLLGCARNFADMLSAFSIINVVSFLFAFVLYLIFITRHLRGQNWVRIIVSLFLLFLIFLTLRASAWIAALLIASFGVPFWMPSANTWVSSQCHRSNV